MYVELNMSISYRILDNRESYLNKVQSSTLWYFNLYEPNTCIFQIQRSVTGRFRLDRIQCISYVGYLSYIDKYSNIEYLKNNNNKDDVSHVKI